MGGEAVHDHYFCLELVVVAVEFEPRCAVAQFTTGSLRGTVADNKNGILEATHRVAQVVLTTAGVHHARGGNDDGRAFKKVESFGFPHVRNVGEIVKAEGVVIRQHVFLQFGVVAFGVSAENGGSVHGQGAVHEDLYFGQLSGTFQLVEHVNDLLRTPNAKGGDKKFSTIFYAGISDDFQKLLDLIRFLLMLPVAVSRLAEKVITGRHRLWIPKDWAVGAADVSGEAEHGRRSVFAPNAQGYAGTAKDVAGVAVK